MHLMHTIAFVVSNMCKKEELDLFDEAQTSKLWMVAVHTKYDAIGKNNK